MTNDQIEKTVTASSLNKQPVKIHFKTRNPVVGIFIQTADYNELKSKNFWRIVTGPNVEKWVRSKDMSLARIFNGVEITKLSAV